MAGGSSGRSLEETPTWAVAVVCFVLVLVSIFIEQIIHFIGKWFIRKHKRGLYEALEKIKSELMLLGFISLLLSVLQTPISKICISKKAGNSWHPCRLPEDTSTTDSEEEHRRRLLSFSAGDFRRILASASTDKCAEKGKVPFVSSDAIHQLHIFIFVLAVFHVLQCIATMALGRLKMKSWKRWENETKTIEYQFSHDPDRFRFARDTSFGRRHLNCWSAQPVLVWIFCFFRQFFGSVTKVDYLTLRHGFIMAHLAPQSHHSFDFQKYINRTLEEDFAIVVGISPPIWFFAVLFLLFNTHGWYSYLWLPFIPLIILLLVGTKLQVIITKMGLKIQDRGEVVKGVPVVEPGDDLFWFNGPRLVIYLIQFVLFQNAFQLAFLIYTLLQFGTGSCFHYHTQGIIIKVTTGVLIQILCSYVTLPLYALVIQMGSTMKPTIFNNKVATALKDWHHTAKKHVKHNKGSVTASATPMSSRPSTPSRSTSPVHLLRNYHGQLSDDLPTSPSFHNVLAPSPDDWELKDSPPLPDNQLSDGSSTSHHHQQQTQKLVHRGSLIDHVDEYERDEESGEPAPPRSTRTAQHEIDMASVEFSFARRSRK